MPQKKKSATKISDMLTKSGSLSVERLIAAFFTSFLVANIFALCMSHGAYSSNTFENIIMMSTGVFTSLSTYVTNMSFVFFWCTMIVTFGFLICITILFEKRTIIPRTFLAVSVYFAALLAKNSVALKLSDYGLENTTNIYFCIGLAIILFIIIRWLLVDDKLEIGDFKPTYKGVLIATACLFVFMTIIVSYGTIMKYQSFSTSTFDFGIFSQMFSSMKHTGLPNTTIERNMLMSHFGVHFSPTFYLLLPGYLLFSSPQYLLIMQAAFAMAGIFAVYGICKKLELSPKTALGFVIIYAFYPALSNGCFYDFHENKFITVMILFTVYFYLAKKPWLTMLFALFTLGVKEDAAIYLGVLAIYILMQKNTEEPVKNFKNNWFTQKNIIGISMLALTVVYYLIAQQIVAALGEGVMMSRLSDYFINGQQTFGSVVKACFYDIGNLISNCFTSDSGGKLKFILWMLSPVVFLPFMSKKISTLVLLLPMIVINLMQSWQYQYDIDFQYTYGVAALIIAGSLFVAKELNSAQRRNALMTGMAVSFVFTSALTFCKTEQWDKNYKSAASDFQKSADLLKTIPANATVTASQFLIPHLTANYNQLYSMPPVYNFDGTTDTSGVLSSKNTKKTEYFIVDTRYKSSGGENDPTSFMGNDYTLQGQSGFVQVYKHK
ncbi:MAG: DUF2079 domain-containing protein [Bacillota bacterium]|nr:DUF2079 domain-containing protein [Bacillota bacterium]